MIPEFEEDLLHLEGGLDRLDEHGGADGAAGESEFILGPHEHLGPQASVAGSLELGEVEVGAGPCGEGGVGVVEDADPEVEQRSGDRVAIDREVHLVEVQPSGADDERRPLGIRCLDVTVDLGREGAGVGVTEVLESVEAVGPRRRHGVLEVGHEDARAGVERLHHRHSTNRSGQLGAAVGEISRGGGDVPVAGADVCGLGCKTRALTGVVGGLAFDPIGEQAPAGGLEAFVESSEKGQGGAGEQIVHCGVLADHHRFCRHLCLLGLRDVSSMDRRGHERMITALSENNNGTFDPITENGLR